MEENGLEIRTMTRREVDLAVDLAAEEGWNPGLGDGDAFFAADPEGFLIGLLRGEPVGCISVVSYGPTFGFLGFYIVRPPFRGQGYGWKLWQRGMARLGGRAVGLDGVAAQRDNYAKSGFRYAHAQIRFEGTTRRGVAPSSAIYPLDSVPFEALHRYDGEFFPAPRRAFLERWIAVPGGVGCAFVEEGTLRGYGMLRPCRRGYKVGPLFADTPAVAATVLDHLAGGVPEGSPFFLDVPGIHEEALALARSRGMHPVFETARMYRGEAPKLRLEGIFGVTSFELG